METAPQLGVHTTVLVQGDTLGGGLESVMPFHKVIFERSAQAGFPEVLFNSIPRHGRLELHDPQGRIRRRQRNDSLGHVSTQPSSCIGVHSSTGGRRRHGEEAIEHVSDAVASAPARHVGCPSGPQPGGTDHLRIAAGHRGPMGGQLSQSDASATYRLMERLARAQVRKAGGEDEGAVDEIKRHRTRHGLGRRADRHHRMEPRLRLRSLLQSHCTPARARSCSRV